MLVIFIGLILIKVIEMGEWISVEDELPNRYQKVFVADIYNGEIYYFAAARHLENNCFCAETDGLEASNYDGGASIRLDMKVTHWMPLPAPPK